MTRRCSHCSNNGHNSRTCPTRSGGGGGGGGGVRLFGVSLTKGVGSMKKSASMGCLSHYSSMSAAHASPNCNGGGGGGGGDEDDLPSGDTGYASDDPNHASCSSNCRGERKKGIPWTEEEHRMFLVGLLKLGKGDWRGISRNYVVSRTPTQVASHAQKYFIRQTNATRRKRRSSLFDMVPDMPVDEVPVLEEQFLLRSPPADPEDANMIPSLTLTLDQGHLPAKPVSDTVMPELEESTPSSNFPQTVPTFFPAYVPMPYGFWPSSGSLPVEEQQMEQTHEILKPTPILPSDPIHHDELVGMSKLSIGEANGNRIEPSALSSKLLAASSSRQSAFHANPVTVSSDLNQNSSNAIHAL